MASSDCLFGRDPVRWAESARGYTQLIDIPKLLAAALVVAQKSNVGVRSNIGGADVVAIDKESGRGAEAVGHEVMPAG